MAARALAASTLCQVINGGSLSRVLPKSLIDTDEPALVQEMVYGALRWHYTLSGLLRILLSKPLKAKDQDVECLLRIGLYQLMEMRIPQHAAVNETVRETRTLNKPWAKGLVNGVLRNFQRNQEELLQQVSDGERLNMPSWLMKRLRRAYPDDWEAICLASNQRPPMTIRVNTLHQSRDTYAIGLQAAEITSHAHPCAQDALILDQAVDVHSLPGFDQGRASVQDAAAQLAAQILTIEPGHRVLDACAAPGGKTAHLLEKGGSTPEVWAIEKEAARIPSLEQTLERLDLEAHILNADAADTEAWWDGKPFDRILLDAPCSATGVIRRHPDIRLHRTSDDITRLQKEQAKLLDALWPLLAPGGMFLYATCSILPEENVDQVARFLGAHDDAEEIQIDLPCGRQQSHGLQMLPGDQEMDGFYYAAIIKRRT
jgi:16S rRNA (cytosine967-C5)-methyltransferase